MPKSKPPRKKKVQKRTNQKSITQTSTDQLNALHSSCLEMLRSATALAPFLQNDEMIQYGDQEKIKNLASILSSDLDKYFNELEAIKRKWPKVIDSDDPDSINQCLLVAGQYETWQHEFMTVVLPNVNDLSEQLTFAEQNQTAANKQTSE